MTTNNMINTPEPFAATAGGTGVASPTAHGIMIAEGSSAMTPIVLGAGQILIGTTASDPSATTLSAGTGISISSVSGSITINSTGGGQTWSTITAGTLAAAVNNSYVLNHASTACIVTLPATATLGSKISLRGLAGSGGWTATANTGQTIQFGNQSSSSAGSWSSTDAGDCCDLECIVANTTWVLTNAVSSGLTRA
jgi:hypothetical protein